MRKAPFYCFFLLYIFFGVDCTSHSPEAPGDTMNIVFLHHSTGRCIWEAGVPEWFEDYRTGRDMELEITEKTFPKRFPYGWNNYPFDYWNIWVRHAGPERYLKPAGNVKSRIKTALKRILPGDHPGEPTLEELTKQYQIIIFKHCFPVSDIEADSGSPDVSSSDRKIENYKAQYEELKKKLHEFPETKFIVWTGAALVKRAVTEEKAERARQFFEWVRTEWDQPGDNIFLFDFHQLETEGGLYLKDEYAAGSEDSHPGPDFSKRAASLFCSRIVAVMEGRGDESSVTGE